MGGDTIAGFAAAAAGTAAAAAPFGPGAGGAPGTTMPGIGGHELADRLRAAAPALKVMFMSGFAEGTDFSTSTLPPETAFLEKPFTVTMLSQRMRELVATGSN